MVKITGVTRAQRETSWLLATMDVLLRIKGLVVRERIRFTEKARDEMERSGLGRLDVLESILNARSIAKSVRSLSPSRRHSGEKLHVIKSFTFAGTRVYTKGTIVHEEGRDIFYYVFISAKVATFS